MQLRGGLALVLLLFAACGGVAGSCVSRRSEQIRVEPTRTEGRTPFGRWLLAELSVFKISPDTTRSINVDELSRGPWDAAVFLRSDVTEEELAAALPDEGERMHLYLFASALAVRSEGVTVFVVLHDHKVVYEQHVSQDFSFPPLLVLKKGEGSYLRLQKKEKKIETIGVTATFDAPEE